MKNLLWTLLFVSLSVFSNTDVPTTPPNACYDGCNDFQEKLNDEFFKEGVLPSKSPAVYSGVCHHLGMYNAEHEHYAVVLLDQINGQWNFSSIFAYFEQNNSFKDWTLARARTEMDAYWRSYGKITDGDNTARVVVNDNAGNPVYVYWMRQNPKTKELLYITYMGTANIAFCRLQPNE